MFVFTLNISYRTTSHAWWQDAVRRPTLRCSRPAPYGGCRIFQLGSAEGTMMEVLGEWGVECC